MYVRIQSFVRGGPTLAWSNSDNFECWLCGFVNFQWFRNSIAKKTKSFVCVWGGVIHYDYDSCSRFCNCLSEGLSQISNILKSGRGQKFHLSAPNYEWNLERTSNSSHRTRPTGRNGKNYLRKSYYILLPYVFIGYAFKGQVHVFAGRVKIVSHSSCRKSAILKYFCSLSGIPKTFPMHMTKDSLHNVHVTAHIWQAKYWSSIGFHIWMLTPYQIRLTYNKYRFALLLPTHPK